MPEDAAHRWRSMAATLATMPDLWRRLLAQHRDDGHGRCTGCTVPGTGRPGDRWPCSIATLAREAQRIAEADE